MLFQPARPALEIGGREAAVAMAEGVGLGEVVARQGQHQQASAGREDARGLGQRLGRIVDVLQALHEQHRVGAVRVERQRFARGLHIGDVVQAQAVHALAAGLDHRRRGIDAGEGGGARREQLDHRAVAGADVDAAPEGGEMQQAVAEAVPGASRGVLAVQAAGDALDP